RVTGKPVWPIVERPVPQSDVPGERTSPTQPMPTKPAPFSVQGFSDETVVDFTPDIRRRALEVLHRYTFGPLFTPPSLRGTIIMPGAIGGAGWGGGAFDPATATIYIKTTNSPAMYRIFQTEARSDTIDVGYTADLVNSSVSVALDSSGGRRSSIPLNKPPYGTMVAIDLNTGTTKWEIPFGDTPEIRHMPALRGVTLPPLLGVAGAPGPIVTKGGLLFATGGGSTLYALDKLSGETLWSAPLGRDGYAVPMTYRSRAGRQYVVIATGAGNSAELVAFALPTR
ncbi:MAG: PQQ-binding-like beta-propeller repeat protein, partial [Gemmatimonadaceae bacterium]